MSLGGLGSLRTSVTVKWLAMKTMVEDSEMSRDSLTNSCSYSSASPLESRERQKQTQVDILAVGERCGG